MSENPSAPHWNYFKTLCDDVEKLGRFIELTPANYGTYSIEIVRLLFATCSEIDVVFKLLCDKIDAAADAKNINHYHAIVMRKYPRFTEVVTEASSLNLDMVPWENWAQNAPPKWWTANNSVKHERNAHFHDANVGNLLHALGELCVVLCYYQQLELWDSRRVWTSEFIEIKVNPIRRMLERNGLGSGEPLLPEREFGQFRPTSSLAKSP
jgi:hypothetical protein